jgi:hypothetical protein
MLGWSACALMRLSCYSGAGRDDCCCYDWCNIVCVYNGFLLATASLESMLYRSPSLRQYAKVHTQNQWQTF